MSLYFMADSELESYQRLEEKSLSVEASAVEAAAISATPMHIDNDVATIKIRGMLTPKRIGFLDFFGKPQTVYGDITKQIYQAESAGAKTVVLDSDSGGGLIDGMFEAMDGISSSPLNIVGRISGQAQSAMYMLLSQADTIESVRDYYMIGSVGIKVSISDVNEVSNSDSPKKVVGAKGDAGKPAIQETLDELYAMVLPRMADGRNTTIDHINSSWGQGGTMTAKTALSRGMIDSIKEPKPAGRSGTVKGKSMDINKLKAEHPDLYASVFAAGQEAGKKEFKELAEAHSELAKMSGDSDRALEDIAACNGITPMCQVHHTTMATKKAMIVAREEETPEPVGEGSDPQADAAGKSKADVEGDALEAAGKSFYGGTEVTYV